MSGRRYDSARTARIGQRGAFKLPNDHASKRLSELRWSGAETPDQHHSLKPCHEDDIAGVES